MSVVGVFTYFTCAVLCFQKHDFVRRCMLADVDVAGYVTRVLDQMATHRMTSSAFCQ